jgi:hypothetical protein
MAKPEVCPECGHEFPHGWDGIDSHWRSKHHRIMRYEEAWPLLQSGRYKGKKAPREDVDQAAARNVRELTKDE